MQIRVDKIQLLRVKVRFELNEEETWLLAEDMRRQGQIQPIAVKLIKGDEYELVAGRRRWEAAKLLGWECIEAFEGEYGQGVEIAAAAENINRKQMSLMEEASHVGHLHDTGNMSIAEIAERTGHGTSWVQDRLALLAIPDNLKELVHGGHIKLGAALTLARVTNKEQLDYFIHCARVGGCTAQTAEAWWLDWQAREKMNAANSYDGTIPQPLPLPEPPPVNCFLCGESKPRDYVSMTYTCTECAAMVTAEKTKALRNLPTTQETNSTEGARQS
jgi:ParB/RepB/Spo0J family partition protein